MTPVDVFLIACSYAEMLAKCAPTSDTVGSRRWLLRDGSLLVEEGVDITYLRTVRDGVPLTSRILDTSVSKAVIKRTVADAYDSVS